MSNEKLYTSLSKLAHNRIRHNAYMNKWRNNRRIMAIEYLGGKCKVCGVTRHLEFDHIIPSTKRIPSNRLMTIRIELFWKEIRKCQLLCHRHHLVKTASENSHN